MNDSGMSKSLSQVRITFVILIVVAASQLEILVTVRSPAVRCARE
jgi:hypothetical protein